jgi:ABC-type multidrug transport system ATPase subunit
MEFMADVPVVDTHEHLPTEEDRVARKVDFSLMFSHYCVGDLKSAGMRPDDLNSFTGDKLTARVADLSGGERRRLQFLRLLLDEPNVLLLDEPTNDLDVDTLRALEDALVAFAGCAVVISHDRWFLDRVATHILAFEGDSKVTWFEGNYQAYHEQRRKLLGDKADQPTRIRFRPIGNRELR